jgi:hypothetical protein
MIAHQLDDQRRGALHEKLSSVARLHRLACTASGLNGEHLALVCPGERLCDLSAGGPATTRRPGARGRIDYQRLLGELREACLPVVDSDAIKSGQQIGECVSFAELQAITDLTLKQITSLFGRYSSVLSGRVARRRC